MSFSITLSNRAEEQIFEAMIWYNEKVKGLGKTFYIEILSCFDTISKNPDAFIIKYKMVRVQKR